MSNIFILSITFLIFLILTLSFIYFVIKNEREYIKLSGRYEKSPLLKIDRYQRIYHKNLKLLFIFLIPMLFIIFSMTISIFFWNNSSALDRQHLPQPLVIEFTEQDRSILLSQNRGSIEPIKIEYSYPELGNIVRILVFPLIACGIFGFFFYIFNKYASKYVITLASLFSVGTFTAVGGLELIQKLNIHSINLWEKNYNYQKSALLDAADSHGGIPYPLYTSGLTCGNASALSVTGFASKAKTLPDARQIDVVVDRIKQQASTGRVQAVFLIGSTDNTPIVSDEWALDGIDSNFTLAVQRASWVRDQLQARLTDWANIPYLILAGGVNTRDSGQASGSQDRAVQICLAFAAVPTSKAEISEEP